MHNLYRRQLKEYLKELKRRMPTATPEELIKIRHTMGFIKDEIRDDNLAYTGIPDEDGILSPSFSDLYEYMCEYEKSITPKFMKVVSCLAATDPAITMEPFNGTELLTPDEKIEYVKEILHRSLDQKLYEIFLKIYDDRINSIEFGNFGIIGGDSIYFWALSKVFIRIEEFCDLLDIGALTHECGHGVDAMCNYHPRISKDNSIYDEIVSIFFELLAIDYLKADPVYSKNATLHSMNIHNSYRGYALKTVFSQEYIRRANERNIHLQDGSLFETLETPRRFLKDGDMFSEDEIMTFEYGQNATYGFGYAVALKLFFVYSQDKDTGLKLLHKIIEIDKGLSPREYMDEVERILGNMDELKEGKRLFLLPKSVNF